MKISVIVKPNARENQVKKVGRNSLQVHTTAQAKDNKANQAVIEQLSSYMGINKNRIFIVHGKKSRRKTIEVIEFF
jgi:hypothetical protein